MDKTLTQIKNYIRMAWRFRWAALFTATLVCAAGWLVVALLPTKYEVSTRVYLDTQSLLTPLLKGLAVDSGAEKEAARLITQTLLVRPNLEAVARKTDMDLEVTTPEEFERLIDGLLTRIGVTQTKRNNIFRITYEDRDPKQAYRVVEALLNIFVERSLGDSRKDTSTTRQFIEEQIKDYETRLLSAEARLKEFKRQNVGLMPSDGQSYFQRLDKLKLQVSEATLALNEGQRRVDVLLAQLEGVPAYFETPAVPVAPTGAAAEDPTASLRQRITGLRGRLDQLLLQYTDRHPDVTATRTAIETLEAELGRMVEKAAVASSGAPAANAPKGTRVPNPLYQELKVSLGTGEAEVAALKARVAEYERRQDDLRKLVDTIPKVEAELARLNRDYAIDKRNYDELVQRRESLKISDEASQTTDDVRFNVIEPPREPLVPVGPNRILFSAIVLIVGLAAGGLIGFGIGMVKPAFYTREDCEELTGLPVLGVVSRVWTRGELLRRRMEVATFGVGCVVLMCVFGAVVATHTVYVDVMVDLNIVERLGNLRDRLL